ncbi:unnamed protein product [Prorocentrum cordatum]|uniref:Longin domain-containing protein n=1 Tax=Prorocentrum cordatum TaxID=2364126 RepID=A0ABN9XW74_9DINO|nr:unnamed protein product [Polarella glacialis]
MAHVTYLARQNDGLILVETWDDANKVTQTIKSQAKQLLRKLGSMPPRCSVEAAGDFVFHYAMDSGVCYMALFDKSYPKNLAFAFLEEIQRLFEEELQREFGTGSVDYRSKIETIEKPYYFIKFDRQITKKKAEYKDPKSNKALAKLNSSLMEVSSVMQKNMDEILQRGENLEEVGNKASKLKYASKEFAGMTKMLSLQTMLTKYGVPAVIGLSYSGAADHLLQGLEAVSGSSSFSSSFSSFSSFFLLSSRRRARAAS